jgi:hypothetical protein
MRPLSHPHKRNRQQKRVLFIQAENAVPTLASFESPPTTRASAKLSLILIPLEIPGRRLRQQQQIDHADGERHCTGLGRRSRGADLKARSDFASSEGVSRAT